MFEHRLDQFQNRKVVFHWLLMSFNAGCINAGGFLATGKFVTHVTGFATLFGVDLLDFRPLAALGILSVPVFFLLGSFIAGLLIDRPIHLGRKPHFDYVMELSALCLLAASVFGELDYYGQFGGSFHIRNTYVLLALLCLASGLQNAAFTSSSGSSVRTTHLTGITTDLGLGMARLLTIQRRPSEARKKEIALNSIRAATIFAFILGSVVGAGLFTLFHFLGFLLSAALCAYASVYWRSQKMKAQRPDGL